MGLEYLTMTPIFFGSQSKCIWSPITQIIFFLLRSKIKIVPDLLAKQIELILQEILPLNF